jgi:RimJ/RimL family protein N-acetyltransferase
MLALRDVVAPVLLRPAGVPSATRPFMGSDHTFVAITNWRTEGAVLATRRVQLREPGPADLASLVGVLSLADASSFGLDAPASDAAIKALIDRAPRDRAKGHALTFVIVLTSTSEVVGLLQIRPLDPAFEAGEWECTLAPAVRGHGVFLEAARLAGSYLFGAVGAHRLEARVLLQNGRGNGALRKLGAVQEGILRQAARAGAGYADQVLWAVLKEDWGRHWVAAGPRVH